MNTGKPSKSSSSRERGRTPVRGQGWKKRTTIASEKFDQVAAAVLKSLTTSPIRFYDLVERVAARLSGFAGSIPWYTLSVLRELEVRGRVVRSGPPVRYAKAGASRGGRRSSPGPRK